MICRKMWSYYKKVKLDSWLDCSKEIRLKGANGSTGRNSHQRKLCGQEDR
jgi:hypothetical protein